MLVFFGTYAYSHNPGLAFQQMDDILDYTDYASASKKPNILFILTDDQGDQTELDCC